MIFTAKRIPSLDGIRAFAIATVVLCHIQQRFSFGRYGLPPIDGVELFFVLSGFLITSLLLREQERFGSIRLFSFYGRRASRVLPPMMAYLAVVSLVCVLTSAAIPWRSILGSALLISGVYPHNISVLTDQLWSLGVEEQFYLIWPLLLIWSLRRGGKRAAALTCMVLIAASPFIRVSLTFLHWQLFEHRQGYILPGRMDSLFAGCLVALGIGSPRFEAAFHKLCRIWWVAPLFFCIVSPLLRFFLGNIYTFTAGYTVESLCAAFFMVWVIRRPQTLIGRVLNSRPAVFLGVTSYSLYLYHVLVVQEWRAHWGGSFVVLLAALLAGSVAFYLIEVPVMWLRGASRAAGRRKSDHSPRGASLPSEPVTAPAEAAGR
jgi:peptidoglycan/LPS O-acetylase OafA/YrhL